MVVLDVSLVSLMDEAAHVDCIVAVWTLVCFWHRPRQPKVAYHNLAIVVDQDVCWLDVTMNDVAAVQKLEGAETVVHYNFDVGLLQTTGGPCLYQVLQVVVRGLHHYEDVVQFVRFELLGSRE